LIGTSTRKKRFGPYGSQGNPARTLFVWKAPKKKKSEVVQDNSPSNYKKVRKNFGDYKWTPLNATITEVMMAIENDIAFQRPIGVPPTRLADKYCAFHDCYGHLTEQCISLRQLIENFIENGKLVRFLVGEKSQ
jgi:hypothetical protein